MSPDSPPPSSSDDLLPTRLEYEASPAVHRSSPPTNISDGDFGEDGDFSRMSRPGSGFGSHYGSIPVETRAEETGAEQPWKVLEGSRSGGGGNGEGEGEGEEGRGGGGWGWESRRAQEALARAHAVLQLSSHAGHISGYDAGGHAQHVDGRQPEGASARLTEGGHARGAEEEWLSGQVAPVNGGGRVLAVGRVLAPGDLGVSAPEGRDVGHDEERDPPVLTRPESNGSNNAAGSDSSAPENTASGRPGSDESWGDIGG